MMINYEEIIDALKAGETLIGCKSGQMFRLENGRLLNIINDIEKYQSYNFGVPQNWEIYKRPKWYENIPEGGVLCWVSSSDKGTHSTAKTMVALINDYQINTPYKYNFVSSVSTRHLEANPLTKQEIQVFMDNAPDHLK